MTNLTNEVKVVHCKRQPFDVYIGRPRPGEPWGFGNPFEIGEDGERDEVIAKYGWWLMWGDSSGNANATPERRQWILDNLESLRGKTLGCWCAPRRCHAEILLALLSLDGHEGRKE